MKPNRLAFEKSPYLLQHAHNPVDWYPWGPEAFEKAKKENKPVFLSIGYSTCHWCHVMEKESFEDTEVAGLMNRAFVSIKVDREERPDIDSVYMTACQMMTGSGGWPLTIIMTPDKQPFFAGTYLPKESRFGRTGMLSLIPRVQEMWETDRPKINQISQQVTELLRRQDTSIPPESPDEAVLQEAFEQLNQLMDRENGGFSTAPKFPTPHILMFLLRFWRRTGNPDALQMVTRTLDAIRNGGIYDHVGFGFHRYSTDEHWLVPHFEKMLYDQAMLSLIYTEAYQATKNRAYQKTAEEILTYVLRDMTSPEGGFFSAEDADSEGEEGKFYVWAYDEIVQTLGPAEAELFCAVFSIQKDGNFTDHVSGETPGTNILHLKRPLHETAKEKGMPVAELEDRTVRGLQTLFSVRSKRIRPLKDDKILADWNGLMITALAKAAQAFQKPEYAAAAAGAADFILTKLRRPDGRLLHRFRDNEAALPAHADDYAFFVSGLIELYEATFDTRYLAEALSLTNLLVRHFQDSERGGFFFTADDGEDLPVRSKEAYDSAIPSGNSLALLNLLRLSRITGNSGLMEIAAKAMSAFLHAVRQEPSAHAYFLCAVDFSLGPLIEIVIAGASGADDTRAVLKDLQTAFLPHVSLVLLPTETETAGIRQLAELSEDYTSIDGRATAYICRNSQCFPPITAHQAIIDMVIGKSLGHSSR